MENWDRSVKRLNCLTLASASSSDPAGGIGGGLATMPLVGPGLNSEIPAYTVNSQMAFDIRIVNSVPTDVEIRNLSRYGHAGDFGWSGVRSGMRKNARLPGRNDTGTGVDLPSSPSCHRCGRSSGQPTTQRSRVIIASRTPRFVTQTAMNLSAAESPIVQTKGKVDIPSRTRRHGRTVSSSCRDVVSRRGMANTDSDNHGDYRQGVRIGERQPCGGIGEGTACGVMRRSVCDLKASD
jgi:hypothetical protein